jgi:hypothetical protein
VQVCPVNCIPVNPDHVEDKEILWQKYHRLQVQVTAVTPDVSVAAPQTTACLADPVH